MIHDSLEFFNVGELHDTGEHPGLLLQRVPEDVRLGLNPGGQIVAQAPAGCEIRFVPTGETRVTLSSPADQRTRVNVCWGPFQTIQEVTLTPEPQDIVVRYPAGLDAVPADNFAHSPHLCRLQFHNGRVHYHGVAGDGHRPPRPDEVPDVRFLAYGTSITHGYYGTQPHLSYVAQAAWRLGVDVFNLGFAGNAHCEPAIAEHIAARTDWTFATLCLSGNMAIQGWTIDQFRHDVGNLVGAVAATGKPVACITIFPYSFDYGPTVHTARQTAPAEDFRDVLREVTKRHDNAHLIEGPSLLDVTGLTADLIHPGDLGMIQIGERLAAELTRLGFVR